MRICALLTQHPTLIMLTQRRLRIEPAKIYRVYTAAYAAGIVNVLNGKRTLEEAESPREEASDDAGVMGRADADRQDFLEHMLRKVAGL